MKLMNWQQALRGIALSIVAALAITAPASARFHHHDYHAVHYYGPRAGHHYRNVRGDIVHSPMHTASRPAGATARCADGSWSFSRHHSGTCSHHGGVSGWIN